MPMTIEEALRLLEFALADSLLSACLIWVWYMALEPHLRRTCPTFLVSWCRLLDGRVADPMVGKSLLAGATVATLLLVAMGTELYLSDRASLEPVDTDALMGTREMFGAVFVQHKVAFFWTFCYSMLLLLGHLMWKSKRGTVIATYLLMVLLVYPIFRAAGLSVVEEAILAVAIAALLAMMLRFGMLSLLAYELCYFMLSWSPPPADWYFANGLFAYLVVALVTLTGAYLAVGGRLQLGRVAR